MQLKPATSVTSIKMLVSHIFAWHVCLLRSKCKASNVLSGAVSKTLQCHHPFKYSFLTFVHVWGQRLGARAVGFNSGDNVVPPPRHRDPSLRDGTSCSPTRGKRTGIGAEDWRRLHKPPADRSSSLHGLTHAALEFFQWLSMRESDLLFPSASDFDFQKGAVVWSCLQTAFDTFDSKIVWGC